MATTNRASSASSTYNSLLSPLSLSLSTSAPRFPPCHSYNHPHVLHPSIEDRITRFLRRSVLREGHYHTLRDKGHLQNISDGMAFGIAVPSAILGNPVSIPKMLMAMVTKLNLEYVEYTPHGGKIEKMHIYTPKLQNGNDKTLLFVHGGAWGSGTPWLYTTIAHFFLLKEPTFGKVVLLGYGVYPNSDIEQQTDCVATAISRLSGNVVLMGHSSGAHIALLALVRLAQWRTSPSLIPKGHRASTYTDIHNLLGSGQLCLSSFVGLSGPYDISHHFDYEAARGVEELSPLKPAAGYTRENMNRVSPAVIWERSVMAQLSEESATEVWPCNRILLVHGVEDTTVPYHATAECARKLRCGGIPVDELYMPNAGHGHTVIEFLMGKGEVASSVTQWIRQADQIKTIRSKL